MTAAATSSGGGYGGEEVDRYRRRVVLVLHPRRRRSLLHLLVLEVLRVNQHLSLLPLSINLSHHLPQLLNRHSSRSQHLQISLSSSLPPARVA